VITTADLPGEFRPTAITGVAAGTGVDQTARRVGIPFEDKGQSL